MLESCCEPASSSSLTSSSFHESSSTTRGGGGDSTTTTGRSPQLSVASSRVSACGIRPRRKLKKLGEAIASGETAVLKQLALCDGGLLKDEFRRRVWPHLLEFGYFKCLDDNGDDTRIDGAGHWQQFSGDEADMDENYDTETTGDDDKSSFCTCCSSNDASSVASTTNHRAVDDALSNGCLNSDSGTFDESKTDDLSGTNNSERSRKKKRSYFCSKLLNKLKKHPEYQQVDMDAKRTLCRFPPNITGEVRQELQETLTPIIVSVLASNKSYKYYQGFHDVCLTVLLVFDDIPTTLRFCKQLARTYFKSQLMLSIEASCLKPLNLVYTLIFAVDKDLFRYLVLSEAGVHFGVSWSLTWMAHVVDDYKSLTRLYDFFLASQPLAPIYFIASFVLWRGAELQRLCPQPDMPTVHSFLSRWTPKAPLEALIADAQDLFVQFPPTVLKNHYQSRADMLAANLLLKRTPVPSAYRTALVWSVATAAAAYYLYNHYGGVLRMF